MTKEEKTKAVKGIMKDILEAMQKFEDSVHALEKHEVFINDHKKELEADEEFIELQKEIDRIGQKY